MECFKPVVPLIKRLELDRGSSWGFNSEARDLCRFVNLEEIHLVCLNGLETWYGLTEDHDWPCGSENVYCYDADGLAIGAVELDEIVEMERERWDDDEHNEVDGEHCRFAAAVHLYG